LYCHARPKIGCPVFDPERNERYCGTSGSIHRTLSGRSIISDGDAILPEVLFTLEWLPLQEPVVEPDPFTIDLAITQALSDEPLDSVRHLAQRRCLPERTVYHELKRIVGSTARRLRWIPQERKRVPVEMSATFLGQVRSAKYNGWRNFVTLDESWFHYQRDYESSWPSDDEKPPDRERRMIASPELMFLG
jgi:hypothetical protein